MGACCATNGRVTYVYNDSMKSYKTIPNSHSQLRKSIKSEIPIKKFDIFIDNEKIESEEAYKKYLNSRTHLTVQIREKQSTKAQTPNEPAEEVKTGRKNLKIAQISPSTKNVVQFKEDEPKMKTNEPKMKINEQKMKINEPKVMKKQQNISKNYVRSVSKRLDRYACRVFSEICSIEYETLVVGVGFALIDKHLIIDPLVALKYSDKNSKEEGSLRYINTFGSFLYYELEGFQGNFIPDKYFFGQENEFKSEINGVPYEFTRNHENPDKFTSNNPTKNLEIGQTITTGDKFVGVVSEILDNETLIILSPSFIYQFTQEIIRSQPLLEIPETIKNHEEISKLTGRVLTDKGEFITNWTLIHQDFVFIPAHKLTKAITGVTIELNKGKKLKLEEVNKGEISHFEHLKEFKAYQFANPQVKTLPAEYTCEPKNKAKLINGDGQEISLTKQKSESEDVIVYTTSKPIEFAFSGSLVSSHGKILGLVNLVQGYSVYVLPISEFQNIKLTINVKKGKKKYPVIPATSISFKNPPKHSESSIEEQSSSEQAEEFKVNQSRNIQEAGIEEGNIEIGGEFELNFDFPEAKPENYSFIVAGENILKYNPDQFSPVVVGRVPKIRKGASFVTTPHGLVVVYESLALLIMEETENLPLLLSSHLFHASVWHNGLVFVVSGDGNSTVETLEIGQEMWKRVENLQEPRKNAAIVSVGEYVYLMGGIVNGNPS